MMELELGPGSVGVERRECNQSSKKMIYIGHGNWTWVVKEREKERMTPAFGLGRWVVVLYKTETIRTGL